MSKPASSEMHRVALTLVRLSYRISPRSKPIRTSAHSGLPPCLDVGVMRN